MPQEEWSHQRLLEMLFATTYHLWSATMIGNPELYQSSLLELIRHPKPGHLVLEITRALRANDLAGFGVLTKIAQEPAFGEDYDEELNGPMPQGTYWYVRDIEGMENRWYNCDFIRVLGDMHGPHPLVWEFDYLLTVLLSNAQVLWWAVEMEHPPMITKALHHLLSHPWNGDLVLHLHKTPTSSGGVKYNTPRYRDFGILLPNEEYPDQARIQTINGEVVEYKPREEIIRVLETRTDAVEQAMARGLFLSRGGATI